MNGCQLHPTHEVQAKPRSNLTVNTYTFELIDPNIPVNLALSLARVISIPRAFDTRRSQ